MYKSKSTVKTEIEKWIRRHELELAIDKTTLFPKRISLGSVTEKSFWGGDVSKVREWKDFSREIAANPSVKVISVKKTWSGGQVVPTTLVFYSLDSYIEAGMVSFGAIHRIAWLEDLYQRCRNYVDEEKSLSLAKNLRNWSDDDVDNLFACADNLNASDIENKTERQLAGSVSGVHAKWLDSKKHLDALKELLGAENSVVRKRPRRVLIRYLDEALAAYNNGKRYDLFVEGDEGINEAPVKGLIVVENDDVFDLFPDIRDFAIVQGSGKAGPSKLKLVPWANNVPTFYFGDMDVDGLRILSDYRKEGFKMTSVLMDEESLLEFEATGTNQDIRMNEIQCPHGTIPPYLTVGEQKAYRLLSSNEWSGNRRVEQEALIDEAHQAITKQII